MKVLVQNSVDTCINKKLLHLLKKKKLKKKHSSISKTAVAHTTSKTSEPQRESVSPAASTSDSASVASTVSCDCCCSLREIVAIDCEFVGVGPRGRNNALGRVTIVDVLGNILYDQVALPERDIVDYRTPWSGLRPSNFISAIPEEFVKKKVRELLKDRIVVGHMIKNDFNVLQYKHNPALVRDTALYAPIRNLCGCDPSSKRPMSLKKLTKILLYRDIQCGEHDSAEDARATMDLYRLVSPSWEVELHANGCPLLLKTKAVVAEEGTSGAISWFSDEFWPDDTD